MFNMSHKYQFSPELSFSYEENLEVVTSAKLLGLVISSDLKWAQNTDYMINKTMHKILILRRLNKLGFDHSFIVDVYKSEIRSILEYAVQVWNGALTKRDSNRLEKVQKIVVKLLLREKYSSYTEACETFGIEKLTVKRHKSC